MGRALTPLEYGAPRFRQAFPNRLISAFDGSASATKSAVRLGVGQGILRFLLCILVNLKIETLLTPVSGGYMFLGVFA